MNEARFKYLPTFQHYHHLGTGSILPLRIAAGQGLVSLKQLVHLPLDVWGAPVAVALGDDEPLAHGCRRWDKRRVFLPRCGLTDKDSGKCSRFYRYCSPPSPSSKFTSDYYWPARTFALCRVIGCVMPTGPSHQPVSVGWMLHLGPRAGFSSIVAPF